MAYDILEPIPLLEPRPLPEPELEPSFNDDLNIEETLSTTGVVTNCFRR
jgi:hypothetical protein